MSDPPHPAMLLPSSTSLGRGVSLTPHSSDSTLGTIQTLYYHNIKPLRSHLAIMPPRQPKRALFSLNLDTDADHVYQKVEDHNKDGQDSVRVLESKGPTRGHTDLSYITRPFEKTVNRAVNEVIDGTGKKVHSAKGELSYSTSTNETRRTGTLRDDSAEEEATEERSRVNVVSKAKRRNIERKYDTSEL